MFSINTQVIARSHWLNISDYQPIITSMEEMAASSHFATASENDFALKFFFSLFWNNHLCIYTKTIIRLRLSDCRWIFTDNHFDFGE